MSTNAGRWRLLCGVAFLALSARWTGAQALSSAHPHPRAGRAPAGPEVACGPIWITESVAQDIVGGNSIACSQDTGLTFENHYTRAFELTSFGIGGAFAVCEVEVGVEAAISLDGSQPLTVALYSTPSGSFPGGPLTPLGTTTIMLEDQDLTIVTIPVTGTAPAGSQLVVDVASADGTIIVAAFFIGSNSSGQTAPGYLTAPACGFLTPTDLASIGAPNMDMVLNVRGTELPGVVPPPPPECTAATQTFANSTATPIPDLATIASTIAVSDAGPYLWDLNLTTDITHTASGDLDITLKSPAGTTVAISTGNGGSNADVFHGTVWDDDAGDLNPPGPVTLATFSDGVAQTTLVPEGAMAAFAGEDPNGTWTLTVKDHAAGNTGTLQSWSLELSSLSASPTSSLDASGNGNSFPIPDDGTPLVSTTVVAPFFSAVCGLTALTHIQHPSPGDLVATLTSPAGTVVTLTSHNGAAHADVFDGTEWDDHAGTPVTDYVFADGVLAPSLEPEGAMGAFIGENPAGLWTLAISDQFPGGAGTLNGWQMTMKGCTCNTAVASAPVRVDEHAGPDVVSNLNGVFESGETVLVETSWANPGTTPLFINGRAQNFTGPAGPSYAVVDPLATYGTIAPQAVGNCHDDGASCFSLQITGARPMQHWDATFDEQAGLVSAPATDAPPPTHTWTLHVGESFPDVPTSNQFYRFVETIFHKGVTGGCATAPNYCPGDSALRKQMAVFVLKAKEGSAYAPPPAVGIFNDVPASDPFAPWIEELFHRGVVAGCSAPGGPNYCPNDPVLRQQMAVFLLRTLLGSAYTPPSCTPGLFADVACPGLFSDWIEDLFSRGIAAGCGGSNFCPTNPNTRGQMAPFLAKTFGLSLYGP